MCVCVCGPIFVGKIKFAHSTANFNHKTLVKHSNSMKHNLCRDRCTDGIAAPLPATFRRQESINPLIKFNTAYQIVKDELPFTEFKTHSDLLKKIGVQVNPTHSNDTACVRFIGVIADLPKKMTREKTMDSTYLSFTIDGDTDLSTKERETHRSCIKGGG